MNQVYTQLAETRLIAILRGVPGHMLTDVLDVLYENGIRMAEITYDATDAIPDEGTASDIGRAVMHTEGRMLIGAGTVLTERQVEMTQAVGGRFIISPNTDPAVIEKTKSLGLVSMPGAMTVTEVCTAVRAGADYVKLFPASVLGPRFVKDLLAPLRNARLLAVGGVSTANIPEYLDAGCVGFGIGSGIVNAGLCAGGRLDIIGRNAAAYAQVCRR